MFFVPTVVIFAGVIMTTCPGEILPSSPKKAAPFALVPFARKRPALAPRSKPKVRLNRRPARTVTRDTANSYKHTENTTTGNAPDMDHEAVISTTST